MFRHPLYLGLVCVLFLALSAAPARAVPLEALDGIWRLDVEATLQKSPDDEIKDAIRSDGEDFSQLKMAIDARGHTLTLSLPGEEAEVIGVAVVKEEGAVLILATEDGSEMFFERTSDTTLFMGVFLEEEDRIVNTIYFKR